LFAEAGDYAIDVSFVFGATPEMLAHFVDRMRTAHQSSESTGVKFLFRRKLARRGMGAHAAEHSRK
jgi:hypothetical protein